MTDRRGLIYFTCVPTGVTPTSLYTFLSHYGEITHMHLTAASQGSDFAQVQRRQLHKGATKLYKDGYVEFTDRVVAKQVAAELNMTPCTFLSRRKQGYGQLWNVRYEKGMRWEHVVEEKEEERVRRSTQKQDEKRRMRELNSEYFQNSIAMRGHNANKSLGLSTSNALDEEGETQKQEEQPSESIAKR
eukprot:PhF_6_TR41003/c0_g1_i1/m.62106/K14785/ESF2, ABT1; ESF2/ABP1 family protein